jgi:cobalt-zinc-cadmium efflux system membrane fusion protein
MKKFLWIAAIWGALMMNSFAQHACTDPNCTSCKATAAPVADAHDDHDEPEAHDEHAAEEAEHHDHEAEEAGHDDHEGHDHDAEEAGHDEHEGHDHAAEKAEHDDPEGCDHTAEEATPDEHEGHDHAAEEAGQDDHSACGGHEEEGGLEVSAEMAAKLGLKVAEAKGGIISKSVVFPAEITLNRDRAAAVSPRYASVIRQVFVEIGDTVKKGDVLASLENRGTLAVYTVSAPLDGVVVLKDASIGESASEDRVLFEVADLSTVWADISIFPKYQHSIKSGVAVKFLAHDGHVAMGIIKYVSPLISHETRTFTARCVLNGARDDFTPGAFVRAQMTTESKEVSVRVEREAVQTVAGQTVVFISDEHGFESRDVVVGMGNDLFVEIKRGLTVGEAYVSVGSFSLKAQMVTSGMDPHAGHGH